MSYTIENNDIVMKGFEEGILDDPYNGIFDMRNIDSVTVPGEASIAFKNTATSIENGGTVSGETVTANYTTNVITHDGSETLTVNQKIYFYTDDVGKTVFGGLTAGVAYYVRTVPTSTTFTISATSGGAEIDLINLEALTLVQTGTDLKTWSAATTATIIADDISDPANIGNIAIMLIKCTGSQPTWTESSEWTTVQNVTDGTYFYSIRYMILTGSQTDTFTLNMSSSTGLCRIYTYSCGVPWATVPVESVASQLNFTNDSIVEIGAVTSANKNAFIIVPTIKHGEAGDANNYTIPAIGANSWSVVSANGSPAGGGYEAGVLAIQRTNSGTTGQINMTMDVSTDNRVASALSLPIPETGTVKMNSINMSRPEVLYTGLTASNEYMYFCIDSNGRLWIRDTDISYLNGTNEWLYLNNQADNNVSGVSGVCLWKDYIFVFSSNGVAYTQVAAFATMFAGWDYTWQGALTSGVSHETLVAQDDKIYFCNGNTIGRLNENSGFTFDPTDATTYTYENNALFILDNDRATCLSELGSDLLIGGSNNKIYPWNRVDFAYSSVIRLSENYVSKIVTINTTAYIFAGYKGRIYVSNGGNATPYYKMPEYLANTTNPYIIWQDATYNNNQLYFSLTATTNSGTTINEYSGVWGINVDTASPSQPRLNNLLSYGTYTGYPTCFTQNRGLTFASTPSADGYGLYTGWVNSSTVGIDVGSSTPFTGGEPYVVFEPIPVGTFKTKKTFQNLEYKLSTPLVAGESVTLQYRTNITEAFTTVPVTSGGATGDLSGLCDTVNFENVQWVQIKAILNGTASSPSYVRLREVRLR